MNLVIKTIWATKDGFGQKVFFIEDVRPEIAQIEKGSWEKKLDNAVNQGKSIDKRIFHKVTDIEMMFDVDELKQFVCYEFPDEPKCN